MKKNNTVIRRVAIVLNIIICLILAFVLFKDTGCRRILLFFDLILCVVVLFEDAERRGVLYYIIVVLTTLFAGLFTLLKDSSFALWLTNAVNSFCKWLFSWLLPSFHFGTITKEESLLTIFWIVYFEIGLIEKGIHKISVLVKSADALPEKTAKRTFTKHIQKAQSHSKPTLFLSYCKKDECIAKLIEDTLTEDTNGGIIISKYTRVPYHDSFKEFMNSIQGHDYVLCVVSDSYLKSQACMYEVGEIVKDLRYKEKLLFVVINEEDRKYYPHNITGEIGAKIYEGAIKRLEYTSFWKNKYDELSKSIDFLHDKEASNKATEELKEIGRIYRNDINEFLSFLADYNGKNFDLLFSNRFVDLINLMIPDQVAPVKGQIIPENIVPHNSSSQKQSGINRKKVVRKRKHIMFGLGSLILVGLIISTAIVLHNRNKNAGNKDIRWKDLCENGWHIFLGTTLGNNYYAWFHYNGTYSVYGLGSGEYETYYYALDGDCLEIVLPMSFSTTITPFYWNGKCFETKETYEMMGDVIDHYRISLENGAKYFFMEYAYPDGTYEFSIPKTSCLQEDGYSTVTAYELHRIVFSDIDVKDFKPDTILDLNYCGLGDISLNRFHYDASAEWLQLNDDNYLYLHKMPESGKWLLVAPSDVPITWPDPSSITLTVPDDAEIIDEMSAILNGEAEPYHLESLAELLNQPHFYEDSTINVRIVGGVIESIIFPYSP